jgi:hypothetical protein
VSCSLIAHDGPRPGATRTRVIASRNYTESPSIGGTRLAGQCPGIRSRPGPHLSGRAGRILNFDFLVDDNFFGNGRSCSTLVLYQFDALRQCAPRMPLQGRQLRWPRLGAALHAHRLITKGDLLLAGPTDKGEHRVHGNGARSIVRRHVREYRPAYAVLFIPPRIGVNFVRGHCPARRARCRTTSHTPAPIIPSQPIS